MNPPIPISGTTGPSLRQALRRLPKAELHVHIEGTLEPELIFELAKRNHVTLDYDSVDALRNAYQFDDLQSFLDLYYAGARVLRTQADFFDMTWAYLERARADGIVHTEVMFDPQTHVEHGVPIDVVFAGISQALKKAEDELGISSYMIMCFLRHLPEESAFAVLEQALALRAQYGEQWIAVGLDSAERDNPPEKFARVFRRCHELGFRLVAHAGEEGPASYVRSALDVLGVERIDHGVRSEDDPALMQRLVEEGIPLTVCPLSNLKLGVVDTMSKHNAARLLRQGAMVTLNSDDPSYFGGYLLDNYMACVEHLCMQTEELLILAENSIRASFLPQAAKHRILQSGSWAEARDELLSQAQHSTN